MFSMITYIWKKTLLFFVVLLFKFTRNKLNEKIFFLFFLIEICSRLKLSETTLANQLKGSVAGYHMPCGENVHEKHGDGEFQFDSCAIHKTILYIQDWILCTDVGITDNSVDTEQTNHKYKWIKKTQKLRIWNGNGLNW